MIRKVIDKNDLLEKLGKIYSEACKRERDADTDAEAAEWDAIQAGIAQVEQLINDAEVFEIPR